MKIFIDCDCVLMQKTLEIFLKDHICSLGEADFIISDNDKIKSSKPIFIVGSGSRFINFPFSKEDLLEVLSEYDFVLKNELVRGFAGDDFEDRIRNLVEKFSDDLIKIIRDEYAK